MSDRPTIVGPEYIAEKLNRPVASIKVLARTGRGNLPGRLMLPGTTRLLWVEEDVLDWLKDNPQEVHERQNLDLLRLLLTATEAKPLPGVYFLLKEASVCYVGKSNNVIARMSGHSDKPFDTVRMIYIPDPEDRFRLEERFIKLFCPIYNMQLVEKEYRAPSRAIVV